MKRRTLYLTIILPIFLIAIFVYAGIFDNQEMLAYDWLMRTRPPASTNPKIVIIEIADDTLKALGRWPLPRNYHAALIDALRESGCKMIVFDIMLSESGQTDDVLSASMRKSGNVYLPVALKMKEGGPGPNNAEEILGGVAQTLQGSIAGMGHINIRVDADGKVRRAPLEIDYAQAKWMSLGALAALNELNAGPEYLRRIPVDAKGNIWVNYPGKWTQTFAHYSYVDVLKAADSGKRGTAAWLDLSLLKDKICFVGLTAAGTSDFRANPIDPVYPMIGTQASICDSILRNSFVSRLHTFLRIIACCAVAGLAVWLCFILTPVIAFVFCCLLAAVYAAGAWFLFAYTGVFPDVFLPVFSIAVVYAGVLLFKFFDEVQKRRLIEKELEIAASIQKSFLPPDVRQVGNIQLRAFLKAARYVGGDLYDVIYIDQNTFGVFIGDVSGKGVSASLIMAQTISLLRVLAKSSKDPASVLQSLNNQLKPFLNSRFVTAQYVVVHLNEGFWEGSSAGHPALLLMHRQQQTLEEVVAASGPPLGLIENAAYTVVKQQITAGDKIFMYTDGWTEARNTKSAEYGLDRLKQIAKNASAKDVDALLSDLQASHAAFEGSAKQYDDLTAMALEFP